MVISRQSTSERRAFLRTSTHHKRCVCVQPTCLFQDVSDSRWNVAAFDSRCSFGNCQFELGPECPEQKTNVCYRIWQTQKTLLQHFGGFWLDFTAEFICQVDCGKNEMMRNNKMPSAVTIVVWIICITKIHLIEYFWKKKNFLGLWIISSYYFVFFVFFSFVSWICCSNLSTQEIKFRSDLLI